MIEAENLHLSLYVDINHSSIHNDVFNNMYLLSMYIYIQNRDLYSIIMYIIYIYYCHMHASSNESLSTYSLSNILYFGQKICGSNMLEM